MLLDFLITGDAAILHPAKITAFQERKDLKEKISEINHEIF